MREITFRDAIRAINQNAEVTVTIAPDGTTEYDWGSNTTPISQKDIDAKIEELKAKMEGE